MTTRNKLVAVARGDERPHIVIKNVTLVNVLTGTLDGPVDISIHGNRVASVSPANSSTYGDQIIDGTGMFAAPGFVDGHVHNESSMCTPAHWAQIIVPRGTTTVFTDPHEIGNVMGIRGVEYMIAASRGLPLRYFITAPSCVPAVPSVESAGAEFHALEMRQLLGLDRVVAIAEAMNYVQIIHQTGDITPIVEAGHERGVPIEGHAPGLMGSDLQAYLAATGPRSSDHESLDAEEMLQKVQAGMMVYARYSTFRDTTPAITQAIGHVSDHRLFGFCTDDIMPHDLLSYGHLDRGMRALIACGVNPLVVYQMATINVAQHYGISSLGAIAPGWLADIVLVDHLENVDVRYVIVDGQLVVNNHEWVIPFGEPVPPLLEDTVRIPSLTVESFALPYGLTHVHAIDMRQFITELTVVDLPSDGTLPEGISIASIVPRHGQGTSPSLAVLSGYPIEQGAIASTVSHDSHNMAIIGKNITDMLLAALELKRLGGGVTAVLNGAVLASLPLPIAGLMSPLPVQKSAAQIQKLAEVMPQLGLPPVFPINVIALALPAFPGYRITDKGLVEVATQTFIPLTA